jgi:DNA polymerase, archaea type
VHAANEVTRRGRETLALICRELAARGVTLLEADTDGVYFAVPASWTEADERRVVEEVAALLPPLVQLELEGRYAAMLSHEPKNYALLGYDGTLLLRGVAFRSSRAEPFGEAFLRARSAALRGRRRGRPRGVPRDATGAAPPRAPDTRRLVARAAHQVARALRRDAGDAPRAAYEALLASGRTSWRVGERVRVYRTQGGGVAPSTAAMRPLLESRGGTDGTVCGLGAGP